MLEDWMKKANKEADGEKAIRQVSKTTFRRRTKKSLKSRSLIPSWLKP